MFRTWFVFVLLQSILFYSCKDDSPPVGPNPSNPTVSIVTPTTNAVIYDSTTIRFIASDDKGIAQVELFIDSSGIPTQVFTSEPYTYLWTVNTLPDSSIHTIFAKATDEDGNIGYSEVIKATVRKFAPSNLRATYIDDRQLVLRWDDNCRFEKGFEVQFSLDGESYTPVDTAKKNITSTTLFRAYVIGVPYYYRVRSITDSITSSFSNVLSVTLYLLPAENLRVTSISDTAVGLAWQERNTFETGYEIEESEGGGSYSTVASLPANTISQTIHGTFDRERHYYFRIRARSQDTVSNPSVRVHVTFREFLYAGGEFATINDISVNRIAEWDGVQWNAIGSGVSAPVYAIASYNNELYVAGLFATAGGISVNNIAKWNGFAWSAVGTGVNGRVLALRTYGSILYAGGTFSSAGGTFANNIAKWDGVSWSNLGNGLNGNVNAIAGKDGLVYAGGGFLKSGTDSVKRIAVWDGTSWEQVGNGLDGEVYAFNDGVGLRVAGDFIFSDTTQLNRIATWTGSTFTPFGSGFNDRIYCLGQYLSWFLAGGAFTNSGEDYIRKSAYYLDGVWHEMGFNGLPGDVYTYAVYKDYIYAGENFTSNKALVSNAILRLEGTEWKQVAGGLTGKIRVLANHSRWYWETIY